MLTSKDLFLYLISVLFSFFVSILSFEISSFLKIFIASACSFSFTKLSKTKTSSFFSPSPSRDFSMACFFLVAIF